MTITRWFFVLMILFLLVSGSVAENSVTQSTRVKRIVLDESDNGKTVAVNLGDEIQIELEGVGGTGYAWYVDVPDRHLIEMIGEERGAKQTEMPQLVGAPIRYVWVLKAKESGKTTIGLSYYRIWEGKDKALRRFEIGVKITP
jgi:predicted secreted protein